MLKIRPYKPCDAQTILSWCPDEESFRKWTSDRYQTFPITPADMNHKYLDSNGDCQEADNFYPMTAFDDTGIVGHLILRYTDVDKRILRFGFVIVDGAKRGRGYGKEMLGQALKFAFELLGAEKVTIGVFENNLPAYYCYKSVGFQDVKTERTASCEICGETWNILELEITEKEFQNHK